MNEPLAVFEIPSLFQSRIYKKITFKINGITIEKTRSFEPAVFTPTEDMVAFRYGVNWIKGYAFTIGRQYIIQLKDSQNQVSSIKLGSYYGVKRNAYYKIWSGLINQLWNNYFASQLNYYQELCAIKQEFDLCGVKFQPFGISWDSGSLFWNEIALSNYRTYFMIHAKDNPKKNKSSNFKNDWNALILQSLLKQIIKEQDSYRNAVS
jgi:hypothetical protein